MAGVLECWSKGVLVFLPNEDGVSIGHAEMLRIEKALDSGSIILDLIRDRHDEAATQ